MLSTFFMVIGMMNTVIAEEDYYVKQRQAMVRQQLEGRDILDINVLRAMATIPRHLFVPDHLRGVAYDDLPLPIGCGQTISQPYIVAYMLQAADLHPEDIVLEIGTGSGYQAAVLSKIVRVVYTVELIEELVLRAYKVLQKLKIENVFTRTGDGREGWPGVGSFDAILVTAAPEEIPGILLDQLKEGGRMIIPVGTYPHQTLLKITKHHKGFLKETLIPVVFVPLIKPSPK